MVDSKQTPKADAVKLSPQIFGLLSADFQIPVANFQIVDADSHFFADFQIVVAGFHLLLQIFTEETEEVESLPPLRVLQHIEAVAPQLTVRYLEHCVFKRCVSLL